MNIVTELNRTINMLMAHPYNEPNSEFADRIDSLIDLKEQLTLTDVVASLPNIDSTEFEEWRRKNKYLLTIDNLSYIKDNVLYDKNIVYKHFCNVMEFGN
jgi:hypothetical protein